MFHPTCIPSRVNSSAALTGHVTVCSSLYGAAVRGDCKRGICAASAYPSKRINQRFAPLENKQKKTLKGAFGSRKTRLVGVRVSSSPRLVVLNATVVSEHSAIPRKGNAPFSVLNVLQASVPPEEPWARLLGCTAVVLVSVSPRRPWAWSVIA